MITVRDASQLQDLPDGNRFYGKLTMQNSSIVFTGKNNILYCDGTVTLSNSYLHFAGNNAIIYLCSGKQPYKISVDIYHDSAFYIGKNGYLNPYQHNMFSLSEQKHIFIGNDVLFSFDISFRTADPHLIYDATSGKRINYSKSIYVGDHVWIGQNALILKGSKVYSGSIIGSMALVANKKIPPQTSWGGNPAKQLRKNVYWTSDCVHLWRQEETDSHMQLKESEYQILSHDPNAYISFDELDKQLTQAKNAEERCTILKAVTANDSPTRFIEPEAAKEKSTFWNRLFKKK